MKNNNEMELQTIRGSFIQPHIPLLVQAGFSDYLFKH